MKLGLARDSKIFGIPFSGSNLYLENFGAVQVLA